jgi:hypothetical protein
MWFHQIPSQKDHAPLFHEDRPSGAEVGIIHLLIDEIPLKIETSTGPFLRIHYHAIYKVCQEFAD